MPKPAMSHIFMCYSRRDGAYANQLFRALNRLSVSGFLDQADATSGASWDKQIKDAIQKADAVVVSLSENSILSNYVMAEVGAAWSLGKRIIPVIPPGASIEEAGVPPVLQDFQILDARRQTLAQTADQISQAVQPAQQA
jgi:hypothetical protein